MSEGRNAALGEGAFSALGEGGGELRPDQLTRARQALAAIGTLGVASLLGVAFSLFLVNHAPILLVAMSPLGRHIVLVSPLVDPSVLVAVVLIRRLAFYFASFELGSALGPAGIVWLERRAAGFGRWVRWLERMFQRASHAVVLCAAGPTISALAGSAGMSRTVFRTLAAVGLAIRISLIVWFADWFEQPIEWLLALADAYWKPGTLVLIALIGGYQFVRWRRTGSLSPY